MMKRLSAIGCVSLFIAAFLLAGLVSRAHASHRDDGEIIVCTDATTCSPQGDSNDDPSGEDASGVVSDDGPDIPPVVLPPVDQGPAFPPAAPPAPPPPAPDAPTSTEQSPTPPPPTTTEAAPTTTETTTTTPAAPTHPESPSTTATVPQVVTTSAPKTPAAATTTAVAAPVPPPPICLNHPEWGQNPVQPGWQRSKDGNCYEIPKLDLALSGPVRVSAPGGVAKFTITIVNDGANLASGVLFKQQLDANGNLSLVDLTGSQGDPYGKSDDRLFYESMGTIMPGQSATVTVSLRATGAGIVSVGVVEPGGEADTNTGNNRLSTTVVPTALQTQLSVHQHGLLWGGHYYRDTQVFARILAREGSTWKGWKKNHPALAAGLIAHQAVARQHKK